METSILNALLEFGAMGLFAAFLVWQHLSMQKRFDNLINKFQGQLEGIQEKAELSEEKLRERYDAVVANYRSDETSFRETVATQVRDARRSLDEIQKKLQDLPFETLQLQIEGLALNQRNSHLILQKGMETMKKLEEEQKIRAMARKLSDKDKC